MALKLITAANTLPVSLAEARAACRIEDGRFDVLLQQKLRAAVKHAEKQLGIALGEQTWRLTLHGFCDVITLDNGPVLGLVEDSFFYVDPDGAEQPVVTSIYTLDAISEPAAIVLNEGKSWPAVKNARNVVRLDFTTGWTSATLPEDLKEAILTTARAWFDEEPLPERVDDIFADYRTQWFSA